MLVNRPEPREQLLRAVYVCGLGAILMVLKLVNWHLRLGMTVVFARLGSVVFVLTVLVVVSNLPVTFLWLVLLILSVSK